MLTLVLTNLNIPVHQFGCEPRILTTTTNRLTEVLLIDGYVDHLVLFVESNRADLCRLEGIGHKGLRFITPANDVHLLIVEFPHDIFDSCSAKANTGSYRINFLVVAEDCHLGSITCLPRDTPDFYGMIRNLAHLGLKETPDKVWMTPGQNNLGAPKFIVHGNNIRPDTIPDIVVLSSNTLP